MCDNAALGKLPDKPLSFRLKAFKLDKYLPLQRKSGSIYQFMTAVTENQERPLNQLI